MEQRIAVQIRVFFDRLSRVLGFENPQLIELGINNNTIVLIRTSTDNTAKP